MTDPTRTAAAAALGAFVSGVLIMTLVVRALAGERHGCAWRRPERRRSHRPAGSAQRDHVVPTEAEAEDMYQRSVSEVDAQCEVVGE